MSVQVRRSPPAAGEPEFYEEQRVQTSQALLFSVMLAQRVYFATFRFGILESSGGLGLDLADYFDEISRKTRHLQFSKASIRELKLKPLPRQLKPG